MQHASLVSASRGPGFRRGIVARFTLLITANAFARPWASAAAAATLLPGKAA